MEVKTKKPEIRFKGFIDEWKESNLSDISVLITKGTTPLDKFGNGNVNFIKIENIDPFSGNITITTKISKEEHEGYLKRSQLQVGDILFSIAGTLGRVSTVKKDILPANTNQALSIIRLKNSNSNYISTYLKGKAVSEYIKKNPTVGAQSNLSLEQVSNLGISLPKNTEQKKLVEYFQNIDALIALHQRKHDKLLAVKIAMLEKMFPKEGADVPQIRFKGFAEKWERRKLIDNIEKIIDFRGRTPKKLGLDWSETGYLALSALNVKNGYIDTEVDAHYGNQELYEKWMHGNELHKNQILFTTEAPMGNVAQIPDDKRYILSQRTIAFEVNSQLITEDFLAVVLSSPAIQKKLYSLSTGGTAKGISQKSIVKFEVLVPKDIGEQKKLGSYFRHLDSLISLHQRELDKLKNIKKACLEKMFV